MAANKNPSGKQRPGARRMVRKHKDEYSPIGLWQFDRGLTNTSGAAASFTLDAGTASYCEPFPDFPMLWLDAANAFSCASAELRLTGALTVEALLYLDQFPNGVPWLQQGASGETEATNILYEATLNASGCPVWFSESGAGVNAQYTWAGEGASPIHRLFHWGVTRSSGGTISQYINGQVLPTPQTLTLATGGTSTSLFLGRSSASVFTTFMFVSSIRILASELTAEQVCEDYNYTIGDWYGYQQVAA